MTGGFGTRTAAALILFSVSGRGIRVVNREIGMLDPTGGVSPAVSGVESLGMEDEDCCLVRLDLSDLRAFIRDSSSHPERSVFETEADIEIGVLVKDIITGKSRTIPQPVKAVTP